MEDQPRGEHCWIAAAAHAPLGNCHAKTFDKGLLCIVTAGLFDAELAADLLCAADMLSLDASASSSCST